MKKINFIIIMLLVLALIGCNDRQEVKPQREPKRIGMVTGIKPDKIEYYKKLHTKVWPEVLKKLTDCNIHNYSIYIQKIGDQYFLFSYFDYTGSDFDNDMKKMAADSMTQRWWKLTDPTQIPLPETAIKKQVWTNMEEVFHMN